MTRPQTTADWHRDIIAAAEARGWAVIALDARASSVVLEEPVGSTGLVMRISGPTLDARVIAQLPDVGSWRELDGEAAET